jgi:mycothiol synthase
VAAPEGHALRLRVVPALDRDEVAAVLALADAVAQADGAHPLGEHVVLHLRHGEPDALHVLAEDTTDGRLLGYAHLDLGEPAEGAAAELAVSPTARRRGVGTALLDELVRRADEQPGRMRLWAHGTDTAAAQLAAARGFHRIRRLWQMRRSLYAPLDPVALPPGVALRAFDPERDVDAWLALNARAFTDLPDQAAWTRTDLAHRMAEAWFDPTGFLLAERSDGALVAFHWTKVHGHTHHPDEAHGHDHPHPGVSHDPIGEVYVVGVDPAARGQGLGRSVTLAGLHHLRARGLSSALLYVDADNVPAIALYRSLGFAPWDSDTLFRR